QERYRTESGVGDAGGGPAPRALGCKAQRIIFQRLVGNTLIVLAPDAVYPLPPCHFITPDTERPPLAKFASKIYVAILRCNIRDLAYLCTAQFQQSCPIHSASSNLMGYSCQTKSNRACSLRFGANC